MNASVQRAATDWETYYARPFPAAHATRAYTAHRIRTVLSRCADRPSVGLSGLNSTVTELGAGNSAFARDLMLTLNAQRYLALDTSASALRRLRTSSQGHSAAVPVCADVLTLPPAPISDVTLSVGLVEHFDERGTSEAIRAHFAWTKPGGLVLITFPTPTPLYRLARGSAELVGAWRFPDERPLTFHEVLRAAQDEGDLLHAETLWPLVLTQGLCLFRKRSITATRPLPENTHRMSSTGMR